MTIINCSSVLMQKVNLNRLRVLRNIFNRESVFELHVVLKKNRNDQQLP
jgi:hypothetical protein